MINKRGQKPGTRGGIADASPMSRASLAASSNAGRTASDPSLRG